MLIAFLMAYCKWSLFMISINNLIYPITLKELLMILTNQHMSRCVSGTCRNAQTLAWCASNST